MSLMDMPDQGLALKEAARVLRPGGFFQFSIIHPCFAPPHRKVLRDADGNVQAIEVARYFDRIDGEVETWRFSNLPREERERTLPDSRFSSHAQRLGSMICAAGLIIEQMGEPRQPPNSHPHTQISPTPASLRSSSTSARKPAV